MSNTLIHTPHRPIHFMIKISQPLNAKRRAPHFVMLAVFCIFPRLTTPSLHRPGRGPILCR